MIVASGGNKASEVVRLAGRQRELRVMVHERCPLIHSWQGFIGSFDEPWFECLWIIKPADHSKGTQLGLGGEWHKSCMPRHVNCVYNKLEIRNILDGVSARCTGPCILLLHKILCKEVENMQVKFATAVLFLVLAFHTFEIHGRIFSNGLTRYGYVLNP